MEVIKNLYNTAWDMTVGRLLTMLSSLCQSLFGSIFRAFVPPALQGVFALVVPGYGPGFAWVGYALSSLYFCMFLIHRFSRFRAYRFLTVNVGHFASGGKMYYRACVDSPLYRVELRRSKGSDITGTLVSPEFEYYAVGGSFLGFSESTLAGNALVKRIPSTALPQGLVILFDGENVAGVGWRYEDTLVTARHLADNVSELWIQGSKARIRVNTLFTTPPRDNYEHTGADIATAALPQSTWSQIGSKSMKRTQLSTRGSGRVRIYGADNEGVYESYGDLIPDGNEQTTYGTISYKVSTLPGFSGSPVILRTPNGGNAIVGMHICGDYGKTGRNHGACAAALSLHLTGTVSCGAKLTLDAILSETPLPKDKQDAFYSWAELRDFSLTQDHSGIRGMFHNKDMWDQAEREIKDQVQGGEEQWAGDHDTGENDDDYSESVMDTINRKRAEALARRLDRIDSVLMLSETALNTERPPPGLPEPVDPHAFEDSDYLSPPGETEEKLSLRLAATATTPEAQLMKDYVVAVDNYAPEFAPLLTGFLKGEVPWSSTTDTPSQFPQGRVPQREATPEDIDRLFKKLFEGDHTAITEATGFTYSSLVDTPPSRVQDPFLEFRNYRDHTRSLIDSSKKTGQVLAAGDDQPFFKHIGKAKGGNRKKARVEPLRISDEERAFLKSIGIEGEFVFPPSDEKSVQKSMAVQAKKQTTKRGLPTMDSPAMLAAWYQALKLNAGTAPELKYGAPCLEKIFAGFDDTSSGWTRRWRNLSKKSFVAKHAVALAQLGFGRLLARATMLGDLSSMTPEEMVHYGLRDPVELFVKEEGHSEKKASTETWRLIFNVSLADCLVEAYLGNDLNKQQIRDYQSGAVVSHTCGMGHHDDGISRLGAHIENLFPSGRVVSTDASGWDMSVSRDSIMADAMDRCLRVFRSEAARGLTQPGCRQAVGTALGLMADKLCMSSHTLVSGNDVWSVEVFGITASGLPDTTTQNSFMRGLGAIIAGAKSVACAGDDLLSSSPLNEGALKTQGTITKEGMTVSNWKLGEVIEFTSHDLKRSAAGKWTSTFKNVSKSMHRLLLQFRETPPTPEVIGGIAFAMRGSEEQLCQLAALCKFKGWEFPDKSDWTWDGEVCA